MRSFCTLTFTIKIFLLYYCKTYAWVQGGFCGRVTILLKERWWLCHNFFRPLFLIIFFFWQWRCSLVHATWPQSPSVFLLLFVWIVVIDEKRKTFFPLNQNDFFSKSSLFKSFREFKGIDSTSMFSIQLYLILRVFG